MKNVTPDPSSSYECPSSSVLGRHSTPNLMFGSLPLDELVARARTLYTNARDTDEIAALLADPYGYTPDDYAAGLGLVADLQQKLADHAREYGEQFAATEASEDATADLEALFVAHRRLSRAKVDRGTARYAALGLDGRVADAEAALFDQAGTFYQTLTDDPSLMDGIRGLNAAAVTRGQDAVEAARAAEDAQVKETGEAQQATVARDQAARALRVHAGELAEVAKVALADRPQLRELLGLRER